MEDLAGGIRETGHDAGILSLSRDYIRDLEEDLRRLRPDATVTLDAAAFEPEIFGRLRLPCVAWFVDNPLYFLDRLKPDPWLLPVSWDRGYDSEFRALGFDAVPHLPLATDPARFAATAGAVVGDDRYRHRISFIGTLGSFLGEKPEAATLSPAVRQVLDRTVEYVVANPGVTIREGIETLFPAAKAHFDSLPLEQWAAVELWVDQAAGAALRRQAAECLGRFEIKIYGDRAWTEALSRPDAYAGPADYRKDAPAIYRRSEISLNLTRPQLRTAVNQRLFDVAAAGGFVLTDYRADLEQLFDSRREVAAFRGLEEMGELADFYFKNPGERKAVGERARQRVLDQHTYRHRAGRLMELLKDRFGL